ncbi:MAG: ATP-binding protein [Pseudomonadota bacterium]
MAYQTSRLGRRIVALMILASAILSLLASSVQLYFSYQSDLKRVMSEVEVIETSFLSGLENALWQFNFPQAEVLIDGIYAQSDVVWVELTATTGQSFERGTLQDGSFRETFELVHTRENGQNAVVGSLNVALSLSAVQQRLWSQFLTLLGSNFVKTLAASAIMLLIFHREVARHLHAIATYISKTDWSATDSDLGLDRPASKHTDELGQITAEINESRARTRDAQVKTSEIKDMLAAVMDAAQSGVIGLSRDGQIALANSAARHMMGGLNDALPAPWPPEIQFLDNESLRPLEASASPLHRAMAGHTIKGQTSILARKGEAHPRYVRVSSSPIGEKASAVIGTVLVLDDVSEQERNRQQVERASRLDALGQLTGGIAHDFNNLLATIEYGIQLAENEDDASRREKYHQTALASVHRGADLTRRLLAFAKRQPGLASSALAEDVLADFSQLVKPTIEETIMLDFASTENDLWAHCDVSQLENALLNLVLNARDSIKRSGMGNRIVVLARGVAELDADKELRRKNPHSYIARGMSAEHENDALRADGKSYRYVEFSVTDNGPGMDEETKRRAIDPFFTTKDTNSGTGLGLSMVYGFIQQAEGELRIYSEKGHGTTVRLLLPRGTDEGKREAPIVRKIRPQGQGQLVLVVEDEAQLMEMMTELVSSFGYSVVQATNGKDAIDVLRSGKEVELLLTDVVMPGDFGGFELAKRAREIVPEIPVVYMSGYTGFSETEMGEVVAPLLQKPSSPSDLAEALKKALQTPAS